MSQRDIGASAIWPAWRPGSGVIDPPPTRLPPLSVRLRRVAELYLTFSWPGNDERIVLESSSHLGAGAEWRPVNVQINAMDGMNNVNLPMDGTIRFFRLRRQ